MGVALRYVRVYKERRAARSAGQWPDRRTYCWQIESCDPAVRAKCHAHIVEENCWDFWPLRGARYKGCCRKHDDCRECPIAQRKFGEELSVHIRTPATVTRDLSATAPAVGTEAAPAPAAARCPGEIAICQHLHFLGGDPQGQPLHLFIREQMLHDHDVFRCRKRGVHLDPSYAADICISRSARECVFL